MNTSVDLIFTCSFVDTLSLTTFRLISLRISRPWVNSRRIGLNKIILGLYILPNLSLTKPLPYFWINKYTINIHFVLV